MMMSSFAADRLHPAPDAMDSETANLLNTSDDSLYPPRSSIDDDANSPSSSSYFWPAGMASLTIQTPDTASKRTKARLSSSTALLDVSTKHPSSQPAAAAAAATRPRWTSTEFCVYYVVIAFYLWKIVQAPVRLSQETHPNYWIYERRLSPGWIPGRRVDNTDAQYRGFRNGLPSLVALALVHVTASKLYAAYLRRRKTGQSSLQPAPPNPQAPYQRIPFMLVSSLVVLVLLHGISSLKILLILYLNFRLPDVAGHASKATPYLIWTVNIAVLFLNEIYRGYKFGSVLPFLAFLDDHRMAGLKPDWHVNFNICMLRLVSFGLDRYWANLPRSVEVPARSSTELRDYSWSNYLSYILYPPLFIAGPIVTFTSFIEQVKKQAPIPRRAILSYLVRFVVCFLTMEVILHYMYVVAIKGSWATRTDSVGKTARMPAWTGDTPFELAMISFWNLIIVWLKLLLPWRFFRLWSLMDGIDPPENMIRCVLNNYSTRGFWRSWHRSYNLWLIRYLYVPIVTATNTVVATLLVFTFVALWHDLSLHLLAWGWLITLFVIPEMIAVKVVPETKYGDQPWYRHICAVGALGNILMMITANTIGFVLGVDNTVAFLREVCGTLSGITFLAQACVAVFAAVHLMFEYREEELRRDIVRKC